ncbi:MAG: hypothetical protein M1837_001537 [Sclerophora amabilis]|nr:MAG: hypothetical protein M1837_001537 [Sclerophora amabilis]
MNKQAPVEKDHWSAEAYSSAAAFVPRLTSTVFSYLNPQRDENILDFGCGDGILTAQIAECARSVVGLDASSSMIASAKERCTDMDNCDFKIQDCRHLDREVRATLGSFDKIFSNAALHWILRDASTRLSVLQAAHDLLIPGGLFVFEMGGHGNVADVHAALRAALIHRGVGAEQIQRACPWFFPSETWMTKALTASGFEIQTLETEYRPTRLTTEAGGGLEGWVRLMGASFLDALPTQEERDGAVDEVGQVLSDVIAREEDGSMWLGYVRLRAVARRP